MTSANSLILGLGLFFLGLRLIGENLRRLYGSSFRNVIKRTTHSPLFGAGLGTAGRAWLRQRACADQASLFCRLQAELRGQPITRGQYGFDDIHLPRIFGPKSEKRCFDFSWECDKWRPPL